MTDAVEYLSTLDFVDPSRIGVTGHSMGGGYADATARYYTKQAKDGLGENKVAAATHLQTGIAFVKFKCC